MCVGLFWSFIACTADWNAQKPIHTIYDIWVVILVLGNTAERTIYMEPLWDQRRNKWVCVCVCVMSASMAFDVRTHFHRATIPVQLNIYICCSYRHLSGGEYTPTSIKYKHTETHSNCLIVYTIKHIYLCVCVFLYVCILFVSNYFIQINHVGSLSMCSLRNKDVFF